MPESKLSPLTFRCHNPAQNFMYFVVHVMLQSLHTTSFHNNTANIIPSRWHDVISIYCFIIWVFDKGLKPNLHQIYHRIVYMLYRL